MALPINYDTIVSYLIIWSSHGCFIKDLRWSLENQKLLWTPCYPSQKLIFDYGCGCNWIRWIWFRFLIEIICSKRKARNDRLNPTARITNGPVKFLRDSDEFLFFDFLFGVFPVHCGGIGRNQVSQKSISPVWCRFNTLFRITITIVIKE